MPVAKQAVDNYLNRQLESLAWVKDLGPLEVEELLASISPAPQFTIPKSLLRIDQKICILLGIAYPGLVYMSDLGLGKTGISLELLSYLYFERGVINKAFVFTPTNEVAEGWEDEIKKWGFEIPYIRITQNSSKEKWARLNEFKEGIVIGTYSGISAMVSPLVYNEQKKRKEREVSQKLVSALTADVGAVVYDQSTKVGNRGSLNFDVCKHFSKAASHRFALAGRAFGRDPLPLWSQFFLTDRGYALGTGITLFREAFYSQIKTKYGFKWEQRKRKQKQLASFIAASSVRYSIDECMDLPQKTYIRRECEFPDENWQYYEDVWKELLKSHGNYREVKNSFLRLRQISSGFIGFMDDDTGERAQIEFTNNPKLDLLMQALDEIPEDRKLVIFHEFNYSGARISLELAKKGIKHGRLWGGTKDWTPIKDSFNSDPEYRILVANSKKAAMGLNLQVANYEFFYESPVSAIDRYESEGRIRRTGQTHPCFYYDLLMKDSVDHDILAFHQEGADLAAALFKNPQGFKKARSAR